MTGWVPVQPEYPPASPKFASSIPLDAQLCLVDPGAKIFEHMERLLMAFQPVFARPGLQSGDPTTTTN